MSHRDVESGRRKASSILLYRDIPGLLLGPRDLVLLLDHHRREAGSLRRVAENISQLIVSENARCTVVAAESMVAKNV